MSGLLEECLAAIVSLHSIIYGISWHDGMAGRNGTGRFCSCSLTEGIRCGWERASDVLNNRIY